MKSKHIAFGLALSLACVTGSASAFSLSDFFGFSFFQKKTESTGVGLDERGGCTPGAGHGNPGTGPTCNF